MEDPGILKRRRGAIPKGLGANLLFWPFSPKTAEIERSWTERGSISSAHFDRRRRKWPSWFHIQQSDICLGGGGGLRLQWWSLAEGRSASSEVPCPGGWEGGGLRPELGKSPVQRGPMSRGEGVYSEVQSIMGNGHMGPPEQNDREIPVKALPSCNFLGGW